MSLELFYLHTCPYSQMVLKHLRDTGLEHEVIIREIGEDPAAMERLKKITGATQVPCLVTPNNVILESDEIVRFFNREAQARRMKNAS